MPSILKRGHRRNQVDTKALHSPRQTTIILSAPFIGVQTPIVLTKLTLFEVQVLVFQLSQGCQKLIVMLLLSQFNLFLDFLFTLVDNDCPCKDNYFIPSSQI